MLLKMKRSEKPLQIESGNAKLYGKRIVELVVKPVFFFRYNVLCDSDSVFVLCLLPHHLVCSGWSGEREYNHRKKTTKKYINLYPRFGESCLCCRPFIAHLTLFSAYFARGHCYYKGFVTIKTVKSNWPSTHTAVRTHRR
jgi:hypothetical protein